VAVVDDDDYAWLSKWKWCAGAGGPYAVRTGKLADGERRGKAILMHREIMRPDDGLQVDHINGNTLDNRRCNLRPCTPTQNAQHITKRKNPHSRHKGVRKDACGYWMAHVSNNGRFEYLGYFGSEDEAAAAYNRRATELYGEFADLNDVCDVEPTRLGFERRNTSGHYGVTWDRARGKWKAKLRNGKKHVYLGRYDSLREASTAVDVYLGNPAYGDYIDPVPFRDV